MRYDAGVGERGRFSRRAFLRDAALGAAVLTCPISGLAAGSDEQAAIEAALPATAPVKPLRSRKLLIFSLNV